MSTPLIETRELKKYFKTSKGMLHAVDGVNLSISAGSTLGVVGESGCGKSTLGRTILRLIEPTSGEILYNGQNIAAYNTRQMLSIRKEMQIIFQDPFSSLNPRMSVRDIIAEPIRVCKLCHSNAEINQRVDRLMDTVGLASRFENAYPHELDGGRRQRIGIARALAVEPKFIVCDEPVSALDVSIQAQILNLLMDLQENMGLTYMFITHDLSVVKHISNEIAVMYLGQCVERVASERLFENPLHPYTKALLSAIPIPKLMPRERGAGVIKGEVSNPIDPKPGCRFAARCPLASARCQEDLHLIEAEPGHFVACTLYTGGAK
ncbi:MAG: peptide ABC transporter ATP-binding protein [Clostridia bacterium]|nr:MAG: peptide ABC transporter ATP-binding protein [Clostridia bacterium]